MPFTHFTYPTHFTHFTYPTHFTHFTYPTHFTHPLIHPSLPASQFPIILATRSIHPILL